MFRILLFLLVVFALGLGFAWLADRPGNMVIHFGGYQYQVSLMVAAVAITTIVAAVMIVWWLVKAIWNSPYTISRYFRVRQRDRGYQALSTGMIAAGAGDAALARKMNKQAAKLIRSDSEPLIALLDAQASLLEGDHNSAREKFERMLDDPEMRLLGLRGLYLEAERLGDRAAARHYASRAANVAPQLGWAMDSTLEEKTASGDWDGALKLLDAQRSTGQVDKDVVNRRRAVLLTAKAQDLLDSDPAAAKAAALEADRLAPDFAPAAVIAAKVLFKQNDIRKGAKILETAWKAEPHPEVADLYTHARAGDASHDRLARARKLESLGTNNVESSLAVARAALDAQEYRIARDAAEAAIRMQPREGAYLLLADIEEAESGDEGRVRQYLAKALRAPRDPAWVADGFVSERWAPVSPVTGKLDAFEWRVPVERLGELIEQDDIAIHPSLAPPKPAAPEVSEPDKDVGGPLKGTAATAALPAGDDVSEAEVIEERAADASGPVAPPLPDDPGVEPSPDEKKSERRFRLF
ncbi:MAG TPA: heme biosynthesis protein HemY [Rhizobiaceae bacterium]